MYSSMTKAEYACQAPASHPNFLKSHFLQLPVELQMTVVHLVDRRVKRLLCLVDKWLNYLATPELYSGVQLVDQASTCSGVRGLNYFKAQTTRLHQDRLYDTLIKRPELGPMVRTLRWQQHPKTAEVLSHTSNVRYLETDGWLPDDEDVKAIQDVNLPRLKVAVIHGPFPSNGISMLLQPANNSLEEICLGSSAGEIDPSLMDPYSTPTASILPFIHTCTTNNWFPNLRVLSLERKILDTCEQVGGPEDEIFLGWQDLIKHYAPQLEKLMISIERDGSWVRLDLAQVFESHVMPILLDSTTEFSKLKKLELRGFGVSGRSMKTLNDKLRPTKAEIRMVSVLKSTTLVDEALDG